MAKYNCLICGSPSMDKYCFKHKTYPVNHTPIKFKEKNTEKLNKDVNDIERMWAIWREIFEERGPYSELSGDYLGQELKSYMIDHLLEKMLYDDIKYEKWNMILLTQQEHEDKYRNPHPKHTELINKAKEYYYEIQNS